MKIAISGKGGVGKTTLCGFLGRLWAKQGRQVILVDADPSPNLVTMLGISAEEQEKIIPLNQRYDLIEERTGVRPGQSWGSLFRLNPRVDDLMEKLAVTGADGVKLLVLGAMKVGGEGCYCPENVMLKSMLRKISFRDEIVIVDMEAGVEHLGRSTARNIDILLVVVEPGSRSIVVAEQIRSMAQDIGIQKVQVVLNKCRPQDKVQLEKLLSARNFTILGAIPFQENFMDADLAGVSPVDYRPSSEITTEIQAIMEALEELARSG